MARLLSSLSAAAVPSEGDRSLPSCDDAGGLEPMELPADWTDVARFRCYNANGWRQPADPGNASRPDCNRTVRGFVPRRLLVLL
jgi:hypothetical protein